jgi:MSHA type pilus biogenesis protein MshL
MGGSGGSSVSLTADNPVDFWKELREELGMILTEKGKASLAINLTASLIQVTDRPSALKRVESYLLGLRDTVQRQVELHADIYDVTLSDSFQFGIDWAHVAKAYGGTLTYGASTLPEAIGGSKLGAPSALTMIFTNYNTSAAVDALSQQGSVEIISKPRIRALNNQTALIKVGTETPFFAQTFQSIQNQGGNVTTSGDEVTMITVGTILAITPQISEDGNIALDISPVLTSLVGTEESPSRTATAPILDTKQASTLVRVANGNTVVLGGLIQTERAKNKRKVPLLGDIPGLGYLFTGTYDSKRKKELVIFVTPKLVN